MSAAEVVVERPGESAEDLPTNWHPSPREILARSRQVCDNAALVLDEESLRMERDRMRAATVHSVRTSDGLERKFADAAANAERLLLGVVAQKAAERTNGFKNWIES